VGADSTSVTTSTSTSTPSSTTSTVVGIAPTSTTTAAASPTPTSPPAPTPPEDPPDANPSIRAVTAEDLYGSWRPGCPVDPSDLRLLTVTHVGFDGADHTGTVVVHEAWAEELLAVFAELHALGFPIERMAPVDAFGGSDDASMAVNNTSGFNCRPVTGGAGWSRHAFGTAIDINPRQNPYVTDDGQVLPPEGADHVERSPAQGRIIRGEGVVEAFAAIGWQWGGDWTDPVDYQHFDIRP
jgi:hypothetical protein